jgi:hypothetical protein
LYLSSFFHIRFNFGDGLYVCPVVLFNYISGVPKIDTVRAGILGFSRESFDVTGAIFPSRGASHPRKTRRRRRGGLLEASSVRCNPTHSLFLP